MDIQSREEDPHPLQNSSNVQIQAAPGSSSQWCVQCGDAAAFVCPGITDVDGCRHSQMFCITCCGSQSLDRCVFCREPGEGFIKLASRMKFCNNCSVRAKKGNECRICGRLFCDDCAVIPRHLRDSLGIEMLCFADSPGKIAGFHRHIKDAAQAMMRTTSQHIRVDFKKLPKKQQKQIIKSLIDFGNLFVNVNRCLMYELVSEMFTVIDAANKFLVVNGLSPCVTQSQFMRIHLPRGLFDTSLHYVASQHERYNEINYCDWTPLAIQDRRRLRTQGMNKAVGFLLYDVRDLHIIITLLYDTLMDLLQRPGVDCYIFALQRPKSTHDSEPTLLTNLYSAYLAKMKWIQITPETCRKKVQERQLDLCIDCIAEQDGLLPPDNRLRRQCGLE